VHVAAPDRAHERATGHAAVVCAVLHTEAPLVLGPESTPEGQKVHLSEVIAADAGQLADRT
jgi:hypothetical protein